MTVGSMIRRVALGVALFVVAAPVLLWLALYVPLRISIARDTAAYPQQVFGDAVPYDSVLASKAWFDLHPLDVFNPFGFDRFDCTFAVVRLSSDAPPKPPVTIGPGRGQTFAQGDKPWQPGPTLWLDPENWSDSDPLYFCTHSGGLERYLGLLTLVARDPTTFWRQEGERSYLYSAKHRVAALLRLGD